VKQCFDEIVSARTTMPNPMFADSSPVFNDQRSKSFWHNWKKFSDFGESVWRFRPI